ncbi:MAG TPA: SulP family inorganic anion transporter [Roseiarcus sp.]|nr:SulP family inorganic anion transporter [Roseiarcus sp.]
MTQPGKETSGAPANAQRPWVILRSFAGWRVSDFGADAVAGLTLAAIAIPEQMATARLAGLSPRIGFFALLAGAIGFALFGASRRLSVGADSTIAPIFAGALAVLAAAGPAHYAAAAAALSLMVGLILICGAALRFGFIADLLSIPVMTGFLIGIAGHILVSQAPAVLGVEASPGPLTHEALSLVARAGAANPWTLVIGLGVLAIMLGGERLSPRFPGALIGLCLDELATVTLGLEARWVATLGSLGGAAPSFSLPMISWDEFWVVAPLAVLIALVVMVQTAATTRSFPDDGDGPDVNRDFIGVGAANAVAGLIGAFPVNASPPRTAIVAETGGASQLAGLISAAIALAVLLVGGQALGHAPRAALAGVLLFVATRLVRVGVMRDVFMRSRAEFLLIVVTALAILALPIEQGVSVGVLLSVLHGVWTTTRVRPVEFERIPGTSIWWPRDKETKGELLPGVRVIALQAPLSFLNAYNFRRAIERFVSEDNSTRLIVIEANALAEIDYTGATVLAGLVHRLRGRSVDVAFARLESVRAQQSFARLGLFALIGRDHVFRSVQEAVDALAGGAD